jgi:hypothetical protein
MTEQCVIFASNERVKEVLTPHAYGSVYGVGYSAAIALLVEAGITVVPVIGFASDGFNGETDDMATWRENAPGFHFHDRPIMSVEPLEDIVAKGKDCLADYEEDE